MRLPLVAALLVLNGCGTSPGSGDNTGNGGPLLDDSGTPGLDSAMDLGAPDLAASDLATPPRPSPIAAENQLPGDSGWKLTASSAGLYGFADRQSYLPGAVVEIHAAADAATPANWTLYRLGYYGGAGARRIDGGAASIPKATAAVIDPSTGMVSAPWPTTFTIALDGALITGVYLVKLTSPSAQSWVIFVVREAARGAPIVWPLAFTTYAAYEAWGGTSLYDNTRSDWSSWHAYAVSFDRPFLQGNGAGGFPFADRDLLTFAEGQGYDIDYVADTDVDADPAELAGRRLVVLQGHSEYWSAGERDALQAALAAGTSTVVFGANDLYWQVRYAPSAAGVPRRVVIGYKEFAARDPAQTGDPAHVTTQWRMLGKPENALLGVMFGDWLWSSVPFTIGDPSSWIWSGANVVAGTMIPGLYGFEVDRRYDNGAEPAGLVELGRGLGENHNGVTSAGQATLYQLPSGATVFASGTVSWSQALADAGQCDARVQQATHNLFARLAGSGVVGAAPAALKLPDGPPPPQQLGGVQVATVTTALTAPAAVAALPGGDVAVVDGDRVVRVTPAGVVSPLAGGARGDADGTPGAFAGPRGLCAGPDGTLYVADTGNDKVKKIAGGVVTTLAGSTAGFADGVLGQGQLDQPMSIALTPSGTLVVADVRNMRVRALSPSGGALSTWAGNGQALVVDGPGASASLYYPFALAALPDGSIAVAESNDGLVRAIAPDAAHTVSTLAGQMGRLGWADGPIDSASISELAGLAVRPGGALVLLDSASSRVRLLGGGCVVTVAGGGSTALVDGDGAAAGFFFPRAAAFADAGTLYVADLGNHALRRVTLP